MSGERIEHSFCQGKYTVVLDTTQGKFDFHALRYKEPWIDNLIGITGSNMVHAMFSDYHELKLKYDKLLASAKGVVTAPNLEEKVVAASALETTLNEIGEQL